MPLEPKDAFKVAFLARCVEDGLEPDQMLARVKEAREKFAFLGTAIGKGLDVVKGVGSAAVGWGIPLALAAPPLLGGAAGMGLARATDIDDRDIAEIKDQELLDEYARQINHLKRQRAGRDYQQARQRTGRMFPR